MTSLICEAGKCTFTRADTDGMFMRNVDLLVVPWVVQFLVYILSSY